MKGYQYMLGHQSETFSFPKLAVSMALTDSEDIGLYIRRHSLDLCFDRTLSGPNNKDKKSSRPGLAYPTGLKWYSENVHGLPSASILREGHTRAPLFSPFLSPEEVPLLHAHHNGVSVPGIVGLLGLSQSPRSRMALCHKCVEFDLKKQGYATWRRQHLTPAIFMCASHKEPLMTFCDFCEAGHRRKRTNWEISTKCSCGQRSMKPIKITDNLGMEMGIGLATMADQIMGGKQPTDLSAKSVTTILSHIFDFRQWTSHNSDSRLLEAMQESCGHEVIEYLGIRKKTARRLVGAQLNDGYVRNPIHHLAALYTIGKGFDGFQSMYAAAQEHERITFSRAEAEPEKLKLRRKNRRLSGQKYIDHFNSLCQSEQQRLKKAHRTWLSDQLRQNPNITRSELKLKKGRQGPLRHFSLIDTAYFEKHGPASKRYSRKCGIDALLTRLSEHLTRKYSLSIEVSPMQRITKTYLLSNFPSESSPSLSLSSNEAQALIARYAESPADFRKRIEEMQQPMKKREVNTAAEPDTEVAYA